MTAAAIAWVRELGSRDLCALIGISLIGLGTAMALLRKWGKWT